MTNWTQTLYDELMIDLFLERDAAELAQEAQLLARHLQLAPGARVLDQGCGIGTHVHALAGLGYRVHGVDVVAACIDAARRRGPSTFTCADAARFCEPDRYDGAFSIGSCIGHANDDDTRAQLRAAYASVRPGARYLVETLGIYGVLARFEPHSITRGTSRRGAVTVLRESTLDLPRGLIHKRWSFLLEGGDAEIRETTFRFYAPHELAAMLREVGFEVEAVLGGLHGAPLHRDDKRVVVIAKKPQEEIGT